MDDKKVISIIEDLIFEDINQEDYWKVVKEAKDLIKKVKAKQLILHIVSDLCCASCGYQMKFDKSEDKWGCAKCGHTSQHYR